MERYRGGITKKQEVDVFLSQEPEEAPAFFQPLIKSL